MLFLVGLFKLRLTFLHLFQLIVDKVSSRGFPITLKTMTGGSGRPHRLFWADDLLQRLRASDRQVNIVCIAFASFDSVLWCLNCLSVNVF